jgi:hypothetical protein
MAESAQKYFGELCEEMADRVTFSKQGDVVSLGCDDSEHAMRVFSLLQRLGDAAESFGFFEVTNGREPRKLKRDCDQHIIVEDDCGSAICGKCKEDFGWFCQIAANNICEYSDDDECCIHCGSPEERK